MVWTEDNRKKPRASRCELSCRQTGKPCRNFAMPNGRCRLHGGKNVPAPKGHQRALKHGLYVKGLLKEEKKLIPYVKLGTVDEEITMLKIKLRRAYIAQKIWIQQREVVEQELTDADPGDLPKPKRTKLVRSIEELEARKNPFHISSIEIIKSVVHDELGFPHTNFTKKTLKKKEDYSAEIKSLSRLISNLEMKRKELLDQSEDTVKNLVKEFRDFASQAEQTLPGGSNVKGDS